MISYIPGFHFKQAADGPRKTWPDMNGTKPMRGIRPIPTVTPIKIESVFRKEFGMSASSKDKRVNRPVGPAEPPILGQYREDASIKTLEEAEAKSVKAQEAATKTGDALKTFKELMTKGKEDKGPSSEMLAMEKARSDMEHMQLKAELNMTKREMALQKREMALAVPKPVENKNTGHEYACKSLSSRLSKLASVTAAPAFRMKGVPTPSVVEPIRLGQLATPEGAKESWMPKEVKPAPAFHMKGVPTPPVVEPIRPGHLATQAFVPNTAMKGLPTDGLSGMIMSLRGPAGFGPGVHPSYSQYYNTGSSSNMDQSQLMALLTALQRMPSLQQGR